MAAPPAKKRRTATSGPSPAPSGSLPRDRLYDAAFANGGLDQSWSADQLHELGVTPNKPTLLGILDELMGQQLLQPVDASTGSNAATFRLRARDAARKYRGLDGDAQEVYRHIEAAGTNGMWKLTIKRRTGIHENKVEKILRNLCGSKHIKQLKSVRANAKRTYMLYDLEPAKEVTGGAWFSDGDLDAGFIDLIADMAEQMIKTQSWISGPKASKKPAPLPSKARDRGASAANKDEKTDKLNIDDAETEVRQRLATDKKNRILLPHPPSYKDYPTAREILDRILASGMVHDKNLTLGDMQDLLTRLVYDGRIEVVRSRTPLHGKRRKGASEQLGKRKRHAVVDDASDDDDRGADAEEEEDDDNEEEPQYTWVRRPDSWIVSNHEGELDFTNRGWGARAGPGNGFSEVPCSRCPVATLCSEGGPVEARSCAYFAEWF